MATDLELLKQAEQFQPKNRPNKSAPQVGGYNPALYLTNPYKDDKTLRKFKTDLDNYTSSLNYGFDQNLDTSAGLYRTAYQAGLKDRADEILENYSGEDAKKVFSGGFISDVFDILNLTSYGTVGLLKGKTFEEGVKNRESFSDEDSLGRYGLTGVIGGLILDIATDPLTYIAPWKAISRIPGVTKLAKATKEKTIGETVTKKIETEDGVEKSFETTEGGITPLRATIEKFYWMFGADPVFKETMEVHGRNLGVGVTTASNAVKKLGKIDPKIADNLLEQFTPEGFSTFRIRRKPLEELRNTLSKKDYDIVAPIWNRIDELGHELVDLGVLGKEKYEENIGSYIRNAYTEHQLGKKKGSFSFKPLGVRGTKSRVGELTEESAQKAGRIEDPSYLLLNTMLHMVKDVEDAKLFRKVNEFFATTKEAPGLVKLPETRRLETSTGRNAEIKKEIGSLGKTIKGFKKELSLTERADKAVLKELDDLEEEIAKLSNLRGEELNKFLNEGDIVEGVSVRPRKLGTLPDRLQPLAEMVRKYENFDDMFNSQVGLDLEKLWLDGVLERNGFPGAEEAMKDFFETAKNPFKPESATLTERVLIGNIPKIIQLQKRVEKLSSKAETLMDIDKKSIDNSFINLERQLSDARFEQEDLVAMIQRNKLGDLAGKYVPEYMARYLDETISPSDVLGKGVIAEFKFMKVVMNPATHVRNILSNTILNWWKLGMGPWRIDRYVEAIKEISTEGRYFKEAQSVGYGADTFAANELRLLLDDPSLSYIEKNLGGRWTKIKHKIGGYYQNEENVAKLAAFIHQRKKGIGREEAWKAAESATFNYSQVTPFVRKLRTAIWGMPFITFPLKATPIVGETIAKHPGRISVFGKIKNDIENASDIKETEEERASEPPWIKEGFYFKLPWKDSEGRSMYFDLTYIVPFGDILSGSLFSRPVKRETGTKEAFPVALASKNPVFQFLKDITRNQDFYGNKIFKETDDQVKVGEDITRHMIRTFAPPWFGDQIGGGYDNDGNEVKSGIMRVLDRDTDDEIGQKRTFWEEMAKYLGMKVQPLDVDTQETLNEWNKKRALQTLLEENGVIKNFSRSYIPKK